MTLEPLKIKDVKSWPCTKIHFRFEQWGWMNVILDDLGPRCGELTIHSDWGTWAYTWTGMGDGETLTSFLLKADCDYISSKLAPGGSNSEWDPDATKEAIRKYIQEECPEAGSKLPDKSYHHPVIVTKSGLFDYLERCDWGSGVDLWVERMDENLSEFLGHEPWQHVVHQPTHEWLALHDQLLPALKSYLKGGESEKRDA